MWLFSYHVGSISIRLLEDRIPAARVRRDLKSGVGLILIPDYTLDSEIELAIDAGMTKIDYRDVNSTTGRLFSGQKREEIRNLINISRPRRASETN